MDYLSSSRLLDVGLLKKRTKIDLTKMGSKRHSNSTGDDLFDSN